MENKNFFKDRILPIVHKKIFTLIVILVAMVILFTIWAAAVGKNFFAPSTFKNILQSIIVSSFLTIGAGCLLITGNVDLAQSMFGALGGMIVAACIKNTLPAGVAIILALVVCAILGAVNGVMVAKLRFPAFISTLGMSYVARGFIYISSEIATGKAANINFNNPVTKWLGSGTFLNLPVGVYFMVVFFIIYGILISKTKFGKRMVMVGGNPVAATLAGINANKIIILMFINAAVLGGVAGLFNTSRVQQGTINAMGTAQFTGLTAAIIGGISFGGGIGGMGGAFVGLLILNTFQIGLSVVGINPFWSSVLSGLLLLVALGIDTFQMQRRFKVKKPKNDTVKEAA